MTKLKALKDLKITKEEGLTKDNIDKVINVLLSTPKDDFCNNGNGLNKLELIDLYYQARTILKEQCKRVRIKISMFLENDDSVSMKEMTYIRDIPKSEYEKFFEEDDLELLKD